MSEIKEIVECGNDVSVYYNKLLESFKTFKYGHYEQKKALYLSLIATNALEQIRFQVSFACTFAFGQRNKMEGSSRIVKLIRQDEALHCGFTQHILKQIVKEDLDFEKIQNSEKEKVKEIYDSVLKQELEWIDYLFIKGPIFGLTQEELTTYLLWLSSKRYKMMDIQFDFVVGNKDPLPWMSKWINTEDDQPPPQEEELTSYQVGTVDYDIPDDAFKDFEI
jgi:ribonucleoside-diphosphate reductase beta chain